MILLKSLLLIWSMLQDRDKEIFRTRGRRANTENTGGQNCDINNRSASCKWTGWRNTVWVALPNGQWTGGGKTMWIVSIVDLFSPACASALSVVQRLYALTIFFNVGYHVLPKNWKWKRLNSFNWSESLL